MIESVHCPTCATHYGLKAARVRAGHKRALCFRCASIFSIEEEVARLLTPPIPVAAAIPVAAPAPKDTELAISPADLLGFLPAEETPEAPQDVTALPDLENTPSLTLGDLEGAEDEILEKTLMVHDAPAPVTPEPEAAPTATLPEDTSEITGSYSSAKDAIAKLLGGVSAPEPSHERRTLGRNATQMDVEATLDALESTLSGVPAKEPEAPAALPPEFSQAEFTPMKPSASTMKLTHDEIMTAMKAASLTPPSPAPAKPAPAPAPVQPARTAESDANLLKVQVGQEVYNNVSMDQITQWIEQGRVQDFHMVARQFSENWIEAGKVPTLRPIFDRLRKQQAPSAQQSQAVILPPPGETAPLKKSLFGGLFNRG